MKNLQESVQDEESITNKFMDTQSVIQSVKNYSCRANAKANYKNKEKTLNNPSYKNNNIYTYESINQSKISNNFSIKLNSKGKK
jgi:hypothetical protein